MGKPGASRLKERMPLIKQKRGNDDLETSPNIQKAHELSHEPTEPIPFEPPNDKHKYKKLERRIHIVQDTRDHNGSLPPSDVRGGQKYAVPDNSRSLTHTQHEGSTSTLAPTP